jgi:hypothetical protein
MDGYREFEQDGEATAEELPSIVALTEAVIQALADDMRREAEAVPTMPVHQPIENALSLG